MGLTGNIYANAALGGFLSGYVNTGTINGAITSALTATAFTGVGQNAEVFGGMGSPGHIAAHGVVGCVSGYIGGGGCGHQAFAAAFTKAATSWISGLPNNPAAQISAAAAIGGTASVIGGGKFRNGAMTGAYGYINNFLLNVAITAMRYSLPLVVSISQSDNIKAGWKALSSKMFSEGADSAGDTKPPLSDYKDALDKVHDEVGKLPKGEDGKFGSPQAGDSKKGYRLDPPHDGAAQGDAESKHHFNWWDYTGGKRGKGGRSGAIPIGD